MLSIDSILRRRCGHRFLTGAARIVHARIFAVAAMLLLLFSVAGAVDIDPGFLPGAMDQPQINISLSRTATGPALVSPDGFDPNTGASINTINFQAFLDTGASGIIFAKETQDSFHLQLSQYGGVNTVFTDYGAGGNQNFNVSEPLYVRLGAFNPTTQDQLESPATYTQQVGPVSVQLVQMTNPSLLTDPVNIIGTPALAGKVMVMDSKRINALANDLHTGATDLFTAFFTRPDDFSLRSYIYTPGAPFDPNSDSNPGIPTANLHVKLSSGSYSRFSSVAPPGAPGPVQANNVFIGPDPERQLENGAPADHTPPVTISLGGMSAAGSFLFDTGSAASVISTKLAAQLNVFNQIPNDPSSPLVFGAPGPGSPLVPNQFQLTFAVVGGQGQITVNGFYLDSLRVPTVEGAANLNDPRNLRFLHVPVVVNDITLTDPNANVNLTLDGVFGMNLMTATSSAPDPNDPLNLDFGRGAFDYAAFDQPNNLLSLSLNKDFHIAGDFNLDGKLSNGDLQAMLAAVKDLDSFAASNGLASADAMALADINTDGVVNAADVQALMNILTASSSSPQSVPEPASAVLAGLALTAMLLRRFQNRLCISSRRL